jgi:hypothetical protein
MSMRSVACTSCKTSLPADFLDGAFHMCPRCEASMRVRTFAAFGRELPSVPAETALIEGESSCFYHAHKKAVVACENCGRFLCALCDVEIGGVHRCPQCLERGKRKRELDTLETEHTRYDRIAFALTTVTFLFWPITLISAPVALFIVIKYWKRRSKILPGARIYYILAGILAVAEICGWGLLFYFMFHGWRL